MNRRRVVYILLALGLAAFAAAFVLIHTEGYVTVQGEKPESDDPDGPTESVPVRVECASASSGAQLGDDGIYDGYNPPADTDVLEEGYGDLSTDNGVDVYDAGAACDRMRAERLAQAGELGVLGLLLSGLTVVVIAGDRRT